MTPLRSASSGTRRYRSRATGSLNRQRCSKNKRFEAISGISSKSLWFYPRLESWSRSCGFRREPSPLREQRENLLGCCRLRAELPGGRNSHCRLPFVRLPALLLFRRPVCAIRGIQLRRPGPPFLLPLWSHKFFERSIQSTPRSNTAQHLSQTQFCDLSVGRLRALRLHERKLLQTCSSHKSSPFSSSFEHFYPRAIGLMTIFPTLIYTDFTWDFRARRAVTARPSVAIG